MLSVGQKRVGGIDRSPCWKPIDTEDAPKAVACSEYIVVAHKVIANGHALYYCDSCCEKGISSIKVLVIVEERQCAQSELDSCERIPRVLVIHENTQAQSEQNLETWSLILITLLLGCSYCTLQPIILHCTASPVSCPAPASTSPSHI
jgi:hypothetical protein